MSTEEFSQYVLELANLMVEAHDAIGWGEISNVKRVLQVNISSLLFTTIFSY